MVYIGFVLFCFFVFCLFFLLLFLFSCLFFFMVWREVGWSGLFNIFKILGLNFEVTFRRNYMLNTGLCHVFHSMHIVLLKLRPINCVQSYSIM